MNFGGMIINALTGGLADKLLAFLGKREDAKMAAMTDDRRNAFITNQETRANVQAIRMVTVGYWEMRVMTFAIAAPFALHLWAVTLDTVFGFGWRVAKFPAPFDEWEGIILLSFFGVSATLNSVKAVASALAVHRSR